MARKFDLNIDKILEAWKVDDGIREVIANALDEKRLTNSEDISIFQDSEGKWHIRDYGRGISEENLKQDEDDEKLNNPDKVIGKFGVGLKDAFATFYRNDVDVLIKSPNCDITLEKTSKHGFDQIETLHAVVKEPSKPKMEGTEVILEGCTEQDIEKAKSYFLKFSDEVILEETKYGEVLDKETDKANIYIGGLKVAEEENFIFSYNITNTTKKIRDAMNRERSNVGRTAYSSRVKKILKQCESGEVAEKLASDLENITTGEAHDEVNWKPVAIHSCKILNARKEVVFVSSSDLMESMDVIDRAKRNNYTIITVPENILDSIKGKRDIEGRKIREIDRFTKEWNDSFEFDFVSSNELDEKERRIFEKRDEIMDLLGSSITVKDVKISETMRLKSLKGSVEEPEGLWEPANHRIIIKRDVLDSLESFAGTLLHEYTHAISGASDVSQEFEIALTEVIGKLVENQIK